MRIRTASSRRRALLGILAVLVVPSPAHAFFVPPAVVHTAIGAFSGALGALSAYPFDMVKSQLQTDYGRAQYRGDGLAAASDILRTSGPLGFYRGSIVNVIGIVPEKSIKLGMNDYFRLCFVDPGTGCLPLAAEVLAGGLSGLCQVVATNPLEVVKVRIQTSRDPDNAGRGGPSILDVLRDVGGVGGLYRGAGACAARDVLFSAMLFPLFAHAKVAVPQFLAAVLGGGVAPSQFWCGLVAGSLAAAPAAFLATPADTVKTRLQQARAASASDDEVEDMNALQMARRIVETEGADVLFSGSFERVVRSIPQFGVTLSLFDVLSTKAMEMGIM
jgi:solute carrier family 25 aspartate/glutamate transporter 12/13